MDAIVIIGFGLYTCLIVTIIKDCIEHRRETQEHYYRYNESFI